MADTVKEMMSAYVAGCMDLKNLVQFVKYLEQGDYIPLDELGELQNIASLIPILLEREAPPASLQNQIFSQIPDELSEQAEPKRIKRKVNLSEIIKEELEEETKEDEDIEIEIPEHVSFTSVEKGTAEKEVVENPEDEIFASRKVSKREQKNTLIEPEDEKEDTPYPHVKIKSSEPVVEKEEEKVIVIPPEEKAPVGEETLEKEAHEEVTETPQETYYGEKTSGDAKLWKIAAIVASVLALIFVIMYFSSKSSYQSEIEQLQKTLKTKNIELADKTDFINLNLPLIEIFDLKDLLIVDMASAKQNGETEARLVISPSARRGILQFLNTPKIKENESLQLWVVNKGQSYSVGIFHPSPNKKFYSLSKIPFIPFDEIEMFRITKEVKSGAEFPSGNTYLFGAIRIK
jgi:hypothetical protein